MENSETSMYGQEAIRSSSQLDLTIIKESSSCVESRTKLYGYKESRPDSESAKARTEEEFSKAKKLIEELTLLIERLNGDLEFHKNDMEALKMEENEKYAEVMRVLEAVKEEVSRLKLYIASALAERSVAEKEVEELQVKTEGNMRLLESLKKEIELVNEEYFTAQLRKIEALTEYKEIERQREEKAIEVLDLLVERNKRIKEMLDEAEKSKDIENELFETTTDVEMLETQLNLVKTIERRVHKRDNSMSRSSRSFGRGTYSLSVLKEVTEATEAKKEELASVNAELFRLMMVMNALRDETSQAKEETSRLENILQRDDVKIQKLNSKLLMGKSKLEAGYVAEERISSLADNLVGSLEKLKKNKNAARKQEHFLKEEKMITMEELQKTKLKIEEKERELISKLDELEKEKKTEALVLEKLESLIEDTMESREMESNHCSTITISRFEYEYLINHASQAEETAEKKVAAAEAWVEALKCSTKAVLMKSETFMRESGMTRVEEDKEAFRMERSLSTKRMVEDEIQKFKRNSEAKSYIPFEPVGKFTPVRGKPRRYSSAGTPTFFVIKKKKKVPKLMKFFSGKR